MSIKVLIIGLDALDPFFLDDFKGDVPTLTRLKGECEWHICHCDAEAPNTASGWGSIYTGQLSSEHGILHWNNFGHEGEWLGIAKHLNNKFWDILNGMGFSVGLLNPPMVWPAEMEDGWCVGGFPDPLYHYRLISDGRGKFEYRGLYSSEEVANLAPPKYLVDAQGYVDRRMVLDDWQTWYLPEIKSLGRIRLGFAKMLLTEMPVDVGFVCFTFLDRLGHACNHLIKNGLRDKAYALGQMRSGYRLADRVVKELLDDAKPENFIICADHGHNFSDITPALGPGGAKIDGDPNWLGHTWVTIGMASGEAGKGKDENLTWTYRKLFDQLGVQPKIEKKDYTGAFTPEEEAIARRRLEGLGYL